MWFSHYSGMFVVSLVIPEIPKWLIFIFSVCIIATYFVYIRPLGRKADDEMGMLLLLQSVAINQIGWKNEGLSRGVLSKMSLHVSPSIEWITKQHPGYCRILAEVAQKMLDEVADEPPHWTNETLAQLHFELKKRSLLE